MGNPGKHVRTVDIPEPVTTPVKPLPEIKPQPQPARERELEPAR